MKIYSIKILFVIDSLSFGGAERQLVELIKGLSHNNSYELHLACLLDVNPSYSKTVRSAGIPISFFPRKSKLDLFRPVSAVRKYTLQHQIDIIQGFMNMGSLVGALAGMSTGTPVISSVIRDAKGQNVKIKLVKRFVWLISAMSVSNSKAGLKAYFKIDSPKFRIVYNGIDMDRFRPNSSIVNELLKEFHLERFDSIVAMIASLSANKDHNTFIDSARLLLRIHPRVGFLIVGDGPNRNRLEKKALQLGIKDNCVFTGYTEHVVEILSLTDVSVLMTNTAIIYEGLSNSLLESMAMGVPVVANKGGGTNEIIEDGESGYLIESYDSVQLAEKISLLLGNDLLRIQMGQKGRSVVKRKFGLERYVQQYLSLYDEVLKVKHG